MGEHDRPRVVISKCIEFDSCRWNGLMIRSPFVENLKEHVDFLLVCPEMEIGLGVPRDPVRLVGNENSVRMIQLETMKDVTKEMESFSSSFLDSLEHVDGFILKDRSPSCGNKDVKIYPKMGKVAPFTTKGSGIFGREVVARFAHLAIENEGRLNNFVIREHFLTKLFTLSRFNSVTKSGKMSSLVQFHTENKFLLMSYNQSVMRLMGRIVANPERKAPEEQIEEYRKLLSMAFAKVSRYASNINVLMHALGYFKQSLSSKEKSYFLQTLNRYRNKKVPLSVCTELLRSWIMRFNEQYLDQQSFFSPYPEELIEITDSGKGRAL
ncbi:MAG: DUF1722 domain-containing protein [Spirochaetota bacterium]|nr:MAG: DUF1722 domain-containing protein [Spirochaetota bacterium]